MQAVILAAGKGTRLRPLTNNVPKPMVHVGGRPIIEYTLSILPEEIDEALLIIGYKGNVIREHFGDAYGNIRLTYVDQREPRGTGHALLVAKPLLNEGHFLLMGSDDLYHREDLKACVNFNAPVVLVKRSETPERFGVCLIDESGHLIEMLEKRKDPPSDLVSTGAFLLNHEIFDIPVPLLPNGELNLAEQVGNWAKTRPVKTLESQFWYPINNLRELQIAESILREKVTQ